MLRPVPNNLNLPSFDHEILKFWEQKKVFTRSIEQREGAKDFVFYDGPPGTNGLPHIGHMMQSSLKDLWPRYKTMQGYRVLRKAGWDTHGLPIEMTSDKELGITSKAEIGTKISEADYIDYCRKTVFRYKESWEQSIRRLGRFLDLENDYATYQPYYIQSDWWTLKQAWNLELEGGARDRAISMGQSPRYLYRDFRVMPFSPRSGTTLSNFEVAQGYKDVTDLTLYVKFKVKGAENTYLTAWTTTPWTLLSNMAVAVGPEIDYVTIELSEDSSAGRQGEKLILASTRVEPLKQYLGSYKVIGSIIGKNLAGTKYEPLFSWLENKHPLAHQVFADTYVTTEDGTGLVHLACYGDDDVRILRKNGLPIVLCVNGDGLVEQECNEFAGRWFRDETLDVDILKYLLSRGLLLGKEKHTHSYPFDYRTGSPLMYFPRPAWFIRMSALKEMMLEANSLIGWKPDHIREGRFGNWLENVADWNVTRERYWGSPLPIWQTEDGKESVCIESLAELNEWVKKSTGKSLPENFDPHKPVIDSIILKSSDGRPMLRENFVLDSWFNAGIMPWGQWGYPAEPGSDKQFESQYPADFICEGLDQTRGWFYTLLACSCLVAKSKQQQAKQKNDSNALKFWSNPRNWSSFKNVICTELVLDSEGRKMSKSLGNAVDPMALFEKFGADPVRWIFFAANPWNSKRFGEEEIREAARAVILPLWNSYSFFVTYALIDKWTPSSSAKFEPSEMDRWIISEYHRVAETVTKSLDDFDVASAATSVTRFLDLLTNWYIRRSRRRFWKSESDSDKASAYSTLYEVLSGLTHLLAPFLPFITEHIYQNLVRGLNETAPESVHLASYPTADSSRRDLKLEAQMEQVRTAVTHARALREERKLKVRQPLAKLTWVIPDAKARQELAPFLPIVADEINVKHVELIEADEQLASLSATANFRVLGKKVGAKMKEVADKITKLSASDLKKIESGGTVTLDEFELTAEDIQIRRDEKSGLALKSDGYMTVALDVELTPALLAEGMAREIVHSIQNIRKESGLEITDRITIDLGTPSPELRTAIESFEDYICRETLALKLKLNGNSQGSEYQTGGYPYTVSVKRTADPS